MSDDAHGFLCFSYLSLTLISFFFQVTLNQATPRTPHLESRAGPSSFLTGPRPPPPAHPRPLPLSRLPQLPSHPFSPAWCPLTTLTPPLPPLLLLHPSSKQDHRRPVVTPHLHLHPSSKPTPPQAPPVERRSLAAGASRLPPFMSSPDQVPLLPPAAAQTSILRRTPWARLSRKCFLSPQTTSRDPPSLAYTRKQVTTLGL